MKLGMTDLYSGVDIYGVYDVKMMSQLIINHFKFSYLDGEK